MSALEVKTLQSPNNFNLTLDAQGSGSDIIIQSNGSQVASITDGGVLSTTGGSTHADSIKAKFGTGNDLEIHHNGTDSYINNTGSGDLLIRGNDVKIQGTTGSESMAHFVEDGAVDLYHNNVKTFETTATGVTITGSSVGIGNASPSSFDSGARQLVIGDVGTASTGLTLAASTNNIIYFAKGTSGDDAYRGSITYNHASNYMNFRTGGFTERMRISANDFFWNMTTRTQAISTGAAIYFNSSGSDNQYASLFIGHNSAQKHGIVLKDWNSSGGTQLDFLNSSGTRTGHIYQSSSATTYSSASDYRLKENVVDMADATTRLKQLKPKRFNFIADDTNTLVDGFIAHEVSSVVPEAITGTKDAMTDVVLYIEGDELPEGKSIGDVKEASTVDPQGIDQSKLVPLLVKTIQELEARITVLEG